jgi:hypothetical protein
VGRLENIVARNTRPPWYLNKVIRAAIILGMVIVCFVLLAFTDLGKPKVDPKRPVAPKQPATHVDGIYLRK